MEDRQSFATKLIPENLKAAIREQDGRGILERRSLEDYTADAVMMRLELEARKN